SSGLIHAGSAIITLPLGVLRAPPGSPGSVRFLPDLPEKRAAWGQLRMGAVVKVVFHFRGPFWEQQGVRELGFLHTPAEPFLAWWSTWPLPSRVLTGWVGGPRARHLAGQDERTVIHQALGALARVFNLDRQRLEGLLVRGFVFDWQNDPFAGGAYSYVPGRGRGGPGRPARAA